MFPVAVRSPGNAFPAVWDGQAVISEGTSLTLCVGVH